MPVLSLAFYSLAVLCAGGLLRRLLPGVALSRAEQFITGMGIIAIATLYLMLPGFASLRMVGLTVEATAILGYLLLRFGDWRKAVLQWRLSKDLRVAAIVFGLVVLPLAIFLFRTPVFLNDELGHWALIVKEMLVHDDITRQGNATASQFSTYPLLYPMMTANALALYGEMSEGAGRVITYITTLLGALFVFEILRKRFPFPLSLGIASVIHLAVFIPSIKLYTSWYPEGQFAVILMFAAYRLVTCFSEDRAANWKNAAILSLLLTMLVSVRPDGFSFLPFFFVAGAILVLAQRHDLRERGGTLIALLIPPVAATAVWTAYGSANDFPVVKLSTSALISWGNGLPDANSASAVVKGMLRRLFSTDQLLPMMAGFGIAVILGVWMFRKLEGGDKALLLLLLLPVYRLVTLFVAYWLVFSPYEAGTAAGLARYLLQTSYAFFLALGILAAVALPKLTPGTFPGYLVKTGAMVCLGIIGLGHLLFGVIMARTTSGEANAKAEALVQALRQEAPPFASVQVICQTCDGYVPVLLTYYFSPETIVKGQFTVGLATADSTVINLKRNETNIHSQDSYSSFLERGDIQRVLVVEADEEFERLLGQAFPPDSVYLLGFQEGSLEVLWRAPSSFAGEGEPSLRKGLRSMIATIF
ncbi:MAG: hypothetical protein HY680_10570 [Chloroflexi bacterium]|nr:hypothetical protein [Chloroflexota bacterium]